VYLLTVFRSEFRLQAGLTVLRRSRLHANAEQSRKVGLTTRLKAGLRTAQPYRGGSPWERRSRERHGESQSGDWRSQDHRQAALDAATPSRPYPAWSPWRAGRAAALRDEPATQRRSVARAFRPCVSRASCPRFEGRTRAGAPQRVVSRWGPPDALATKPRDENGKRLCTRFFLAFGGRFRHNMGSGKMTGRKSDRPGGWARAQVSRGQKARRGKRGGKGVIHIGFLSSKKYLPRTEIFARVKNSPRGRFRLCPHAEPCHWPQATNAGGLGSEPPRRTAVWHSPHEGSFLVFP